jgi:hypothetical protein
MSVCGGVVGPLVRVCRPVSGERLTSIKTFQKSTCSRVGLGEGGGGSRAAVPGR